MVVKPSWSIENVGVFLSRFTLRIQRNFSFMPALSLTIILLATSCARSPVTDQQTAQMRSNLPRGYTANAVFYKEYSGMARLTEGKSRYEIRSFAPGPKDPCSNNLEPWDTTKFGRVTIRDCSAADSVFLGKLTRKLEATLHTVEVAFGRKIHVDEAQLSLVDKDFGFNHGYEHRADAMHLVYAASDVFDVDDPDYSLRNISTSSAHELFHLARHVLGRYGNDKGEHGLDEEGKAAFFAKCVEVNVFGNMTPYRIGTHNMDPETVKSDPDLHESATGVQAAARLLAPLVGPDGVPDDAHIDEFNKLCYRMPD